MTNGRHRRVESGVFLKTSHVISRGLKHQKYFQDKTAGKRWISHYLKVIHTKINSKWTDPNLRVNTIKLLEQHVKVNCCNPEVSNNFVFFLIQY